jgi:hypothetical protein
MPRLRPVISRTRLLNLDTFFAIRLQNTFDHHARSQVAPDQLQQPPVAHPAGDATHQDVVLSPVEEFREVHVHDEAVASADRLLDLPGCSVSGTLGSKAVARFAEVRIEQRRQDLDDDLLNQPVDYVWNT